MKYMFNGGRNERAVLVTPEALALYNQLGVRNVLFVAYAMVEEFWQHSWNEMQTIIQIPKMEVRVLTIFNSDPSTIADSCAWADFIYFPGGSQNTLLSRMKQFGADEAISSLLHIGNLKLIGGGSAGAMVMGSWCIVGHKSVNSVVSGLNYFPGYIIDSHFSERSRLPRLQAVLRDKPGSLGMGIDEDTAVVFDNNARLESVFGPGTVTICNNTVTVYDTNNAKTI